MSALRVLRERLDAQAASRPAPTIPDLTAHVAAPAEGFPNERVRELACQYRDLRAQAQDARAQADAAWQQLSAAREQDQVDLAAALDKGGSAVAKAMAGPNEQSALERIRVTNLRAGALTRRATDAHAAFAGAVSSERDAILAEVARREAAERATVRNLADQCSERATAIARLRGLKRWVADPSALRPDPDRGLLQAIGGLVEHLDRGGEPFAPRKQPILHDPRPSVAISGEPGIAGGRS